MEENTKRDVRVKKLEQKNKELETRLAIVEQATLPVEEQLYNDNPFDDSTSNFNLVAKYHEKPLTTRSCKSDNSDALVSSFHGTSMIKIIQHLPQLCDKRLLQKSTD
ncbi:5881_t:CDS:2 [Rhizophagus irregularis]|nr:5881_t:CDS:2 [Rhizophagus irregularis]